MSKVLGLDIGGANIKAAVNDGRSIEIGFPLWKRSPELVDVLQADILARFSDCDHVAVTMTGELCDCFRSKSAGVEFIASTTAKVFQESNTQFYGVDGRFASLHQTQQQPLLYSASNWHALANFCRRFIKLSAGYALLIDMGSTSTDIIPFSSEAVLAKGKTDIARITNGELVYTGALRTPVCAFSQDLLFRGSSVSLSGEVFATMRDVHVLLESIPSDANCRDTADGQPADQHHSGQRLARMLCADQEELTTAELLCVAKQVRAAQLKSIGSAIGRVVSSQQKKPQTIFLSGTGSVILEEFLRDYFPSSCLTTLGEKMSAALSIVAPAFSVANLRMDALKSSLAEQIKID
jgi:(4-(4-[2-(gamma-L-glutamylamino)ethyl]phenoxymethyl)furan-2-yl)methanamine synthase